MNPNRKNLANGILALGVSTSDTTWVLENGYGGSMPAVPFFLTTTPFGQLSTMGNSEIVNVTARTGDTLTVQRAQKGTTARAFAAGSVVSNGVYVEDKVGSENIEWATLGSTIVTLPEASYTATNNWSFVNVGSSTTLENLVVGGVYLVLANITFVENTSGGVEIGYIINTSPSLSVIQYTPNVAGTVGLDINTIFTATSTSHTLQRRYRGGASGSARYGPTRIIVIRIG